MVHNQRLENLNSIRINREVWVESSLPGLMFMLRFIWYNVNWIIIITTTISNIIICEVKYFVFNVRSR